MRQRSADPFAAARPGKRPDRHQHHAFMLVRHPVMRRFFVIGAIFCAAPPGCSGDPSGPLVPDRVDILGGNDQADTIEATLPIPLRVRVIDARGRGIAGVGVTWNPVTAAGSVAPVASQTDASGQAQGLWTLGATAGEHFVSAAAGSAVAVFRATVRPGSPTAAQDLRPGGDSALYGALLPWPRLIRVVDRRGNPISGVTVHWSVTSGGGQLTPTSLQTDAAGRTSAAWRMGNVPGPNTAAVTVAGRVLGTLDAIGIGYASVALGGDHSCGLTMARTAYCWGGNLAGALGDGTTTMRLRPVAVAGNHRFISLAAGGKTTCGAEESGAVFCWGENSYGQFGNGTVGSSVSTPTAAANGYQFRVLAMSERHVCGVTSAGAAVCWGDNMAGQLGDGTFFQRTRPVAVSGTVSFRAISASVFHTCALTIADELYCWGESAYWGKSPNQTSAPVTTPERVAPGMTFTSVSTGTFHVCGLTRSGEGYCWGSGNNGQLGTGTTYETTPARIMSDSTLVTLTAGTVNTCATTTGGDTYCWGANHFAQIGDGTMTERGTPQPVTGDQSFSPIGFGFYHVCGSEPSGILYCWGNNGSGQLGNGSFNDVGPTPVAVRTPE